jgi:hypothetical protein
MQTSSGFGNYYPYVRMLHLLSASLGRRLLLSSDTLRARHGSNARPRTTILAAREYALPPQCRAAVAPIRNRWN